MMGFHAVARRKKSNSKKVTNVQKISPGLGLSKLPSKINHPSSGIYLVVLYYLIKHWALTASFNAQPLTYFI